MIKTICKVLSLIFFFFILLAKAFFPSTLEAVSIILSVISNTCTTYYYCLSVLSLRCLWLMIMAIILEWNYGLANACVYVCEWRWNYKVSHQMQPFRLICIFLDFNGTCNLSELWCITWKYFCLFFLSNLSQMMFCMCAQSSNERAVSTRWARVRFL